MALKAEDNMTYRRHDTMTNDPTKDLTDDKKLDRLFEGLPVMNITSADLEELKHRLDRIDELVARKQAPKALDTDAVIDPAEDLEAVRIRTEKLALLAQAYKEGLEAGGKEEAERRMEARFDELNPVDPAPEEATDEQ